MAVEDAGPGKVEEALEAPGRERRRSHRVTTVCLHAISWLLLTFYATDYLPPLAIRASVGTSAAAPAQYLVGYMTLGAVCLALGLGFGWLYSPAIRRSRFPWRWVLFPLLVALVLIPSQGANHLLTRGLIALALLAGTALGLGLGPRLRRLRYWASARP